jgi:hypothetical protein
MALVFRAFKEEEDEEEEDAISYNTLLFCVVL